MLSRHSGGYSSPNLLGFISRTPTPKVPMNTETQMPESAEESAPLLPIEGQPPVEGEPPIDSIIRNFDSALNEARALAGKLKDSTTTNTIQALIKVATAQQAFMREVRRLFGDIL